MAFSIYPHIKLQWKKMFFLHREFEEEVYVDLHPGLTVLCNSRFACRFFRSLYGLKYSTRVCFGHFNSALIQFGMTKCEANHSAFFLHSSTARCIFLVVYVEDIFIIGGNLNGIQRIKTHLFNKFETKT